MAEMEAFEDHMHFPFVELPGEIQNMIYNYVAINERILLIRRRCARNREPLATRSGLALVCRQVSEEYISLLQVAPLHYNITLKTWVHDFNFRHVKKFFAWLRRLGFPSQGQTWLMTILLNWAISSCSSMDTEEFTSWISVRSPTPGFELFGRVDKTKSGHLFPMPPPSPVDLRLFSQCRRLSDRTKFIYESMTEWQGNCMNRVYRFKYDNASRRDVLMKWRPDDQLERHGEYVEVSAAEITGDVMIVYVK